LGGYYLPEARLADKEDIKVSSVSRISNPSIFSATKNKDDGISLTLQSKRTIPNINPKWIHHHG
jgi:hypothetical protein